MKTPLTILLFLLLACSSNKSYKDAYNFPPPTPKPSVEKTPLVAEASTPLPTTPKPTQEPESEDSARAKIDVGVRWQKGGFGAVMIADLTISNKSTLNVKDILITCNIHGASGTKIDTKSKTIYEKFPARQTKTISDVNFGFISDQANSVNCFTDEIVID